MKKPDLTAEQAAMTHIKRIHHLAKSEMDQIVNIAWKGTFNWDDWENDLIDAIKDGVIEKIHIYRKNKNGIIAFSWITLELDSLWIDSLVIDRNYHRMGTGTEVLEWLIQEFSLTAVNYRYDPIIFYKIKDSDQIRNNLGKFGTIIEKIANQGIREVIFSFATIYPKVSNRMHARNYIPVNLDFKKKKEILEKLMETCSGYKVQMKACCQPDLLEIEGIEQAHCVDAYKIETLIKEQILKLKDTGQRKDCGCFKSKDIGGYSGIFRCKHNCDYCYASPAKK